MRKVLQVKEILETFSSFMRNYQSTRLALQEFNVRLFLDLRRLILILHDLSRDEKKIGVEFKIGEIFVRKTKQKRVFKVCSTNSNLRTSSWDN